MGRKVEMPGGEMLEEGVDIIAFVPTAGPYTGINLLVPIPGVVAINTCYNATNRRTYGMVITAEANMYFEITVSDAVRLAAELEAQHKSPPPGNLTAVTPVAGSA